MSLSRERGVPSFMDTERAALSPCLSLSWPVQVDFQAAGGRDSFERGWETVQPTVGTGIADEAQKEFIFDPNDKYRVLPEALLPVSRLGGLR